ncbi:MAG: IS1595 family transposase [Edaphobacter sp.]
MSDPKTLQEAIVFFENPDNCVAFLVARRWPNGVSCPTCGRTDVSYVPKRRVWQCKTRHAKCQFSVKVGTIFEESPVALKSWLMAMWMIANCRNGVSSYEIARALGITQKSAWFMLHRIRLAMKHEPKHTIGSHWGNPVEVDETFVGGKMKNMHRKRAMALRANMPVDRMEGHEVRWDNKTAVMGMLNRQTREVRAKVIPNVKRETLQAEILKNIGFNAHVFTDQHVGYDGLDKLKNFTHKTVNHMEEYVNGRVHTQGIENFWSLLKRSLTGTYVAVEPFHLDRYVDEQVFRFNNRHNKKDADRFSKIVAQVVGKRLTYAELTGKLDARQD